MRPMGVESKKRVRANKTHCKRFSKILFDAFKLPQNLSEISQSNGKDHLHKYSTKKSDKYVQEANDYISPSIIVC